MKVINEAPPFEVPFPWDSNTVFAYGDVIYNPGGRPLTPDVLAHEKVHSMQQGDNPRAWWVKYIEDEKFRLEQEIEAYRAQYRSIKDRNQATKALLFFAKTLSSALYGNIITFDEAKHRIRQ